jgi:hypothetical protein
MGARHMLDMGVFKFLNNGAWNGGACVRVLQLVCSSLFACLARSWGYMRTAPRAGCACSILYALSLVAPAHCSLGLALPLGLGA